MERRYYTVDIMRVLCVLECCLWCIKLPFWVILFNYHLWGIVYVISRSWARGIMWCDLDVQLRYVMCTNNVSELMNISRGTRLYSWQSAQCYIFLERKMLFSQTNLDVIFKIVFFKQAVSRFQNVSDDGLGHLSWNLHEYLNLATIYRTDSYCGPYSNIYEVNIILLSL
jgi:hypothetical protein